MPAPTCSDQEFIRVWNTCRSSPRVAKALGIASACVVRRRRAIEKRHGIQLDTEDHYGRKEFQHKPSCEARATVELLNGTVVIASDAHYWPGEPTVAHQAFVRVIKQIKPDIVVMNGDVLDGASISSHDRFGWEELPSVADELKAVKDRMSEIERAAKGARLLKTRGNHCLRFDKRIATKAPEFNGIDGFRLADHLPAWPETWSIWINDEVVIKHRHHNGLHATWNNALRGGKTICTGHLHRLQVTCLNDYNGTRYGVDTGTLADPWGPQFEYMEDGVRNWNAGFAVLTFVDGKLIHPELCHVMNGKAYFRGREV